MLTAYPPDLYNTQRTAPSTRRAAPAKRLLSSLPRSSTTTVGRFSTGSRITFTPSRSRSSLIAGIDAARIPSVAASFCRAHFQLGKADLIPVCDDVVATSFQVLHFDMGLPLLVGALHQMLVTHVGLYLPSDHFGPCLCPHAPRQPRRDPCRSFSFASEEV